MSGGGGDKVEESEYEKAQALVARQRMDDYQNDFQQYEDKFIQEVVDMNSEENSQRALELSVTPLAKAFADEGIRIQKSMNAGGVNPNSGKAKSVKSSVAGLQAGAEVDSGSRAVMSQKDNYISGLQNIVAIGQGQAGEAMNGLGDLASMGQSNAISSAQDSISNKNNVRSGVGLAVGAATRYGLNKTDDGED